MDFVALQGERLLGFEAKAGPRPGLTRSTRSFLEAYRPTDFFLVTGVDEQSEPPVRVGETQVHRLGLVQLAPALGQLIAEG